MQGWEGHVSDFSVFGQSTILDYFSLKHSLLKYLGDKFACFVLRFKGTPDMSLSDQLCNACAAGNRLEIITLLQNGADVNGKNVFNRTAIQVSNKNLLNWLFFRSDFKHIWMISVCFAC